MISIHRQNLIALLATLAALLGLYTVDAAAVTTGSRFDPADFTSLGTLNISSGTITFNTSTLTVTGFANGVTSNTAGGQTVAVFTFASVSITGTANVVITGTRPIAILSKSTFVFARPISATGPNGSGTTGGTGFGGGSNGGNRAAVGSGTGGGDTDFNEAGAGAGYGGAGGLGASANAGGATYGTADMASLFAGGSGGGGGDRNFTGGGGGAGGGAIELAATTSITINAGGSITVTGGTGATDNNAGGGGGSGGSILLSAPTVTNSGTLTARGGNGGNATSANREGGGGGGGGRIAIFANTVTLGTRDVAAGSGGTGSGGNGGAGAVGTLNSANYSTPPSVTSVTRLNTDPTTAASVSFRIVFSASVSNVQLSDLSLTTTGVSGASITGLSGSGTTYDVTVNTGSNDGTIRLDVLDFDTITNSFGQPLGGTGLHNPDFTTGQVYTIDRTPPTISISAPSAANENNGPVTYTITYTGASAVTLANANVTLDTTGTATGTVAVSGSGTATRTVTISSITGNGTLGISIAANTATDSAGNSAAAAGPSTTFNVDNVAPTISISAPSVTTTGTGPVSFTITYSGADAISLAAGDINLQTTGFVFGTVTVTGTGLTTRTVTISSISGTTGTMGISIDPGTASDLAGNTAPAAGPSATFAIDTIGVSISISAPSVSSTRTGPVTYTISYTNAILVTLSNANVTLNRTGTANGTVTVSGSGTSTRTVTISGITGSGTLGISLASGTAINIFFTGAPAAGPSTTFTVDNTAPTVSISAPSAASTTSGPITYTITYGGADAVTLANANITLNATGGASGTVAVSGSGTATRTVTISSITGNGTLGISVAANTASDLAGNNAAAAGPSTTFTVDNSPPTISIGAPSVSATTTGPVTYTITYTGANAVTLANSDITLNTTGTVFGIATVSGSGTATRTVTISSISGDGTLGISIASGSASDLAGNLSLAAGPSTTFSVDNSPPDIAISAPSASLTTAGPITYTVSYTGATAVNLNAADVTLNSSGTATGTIIVTGSGTSTRSVIVTGITGDGSLGISIAANTASDALGNLALAAGPSATFVVDNSAPTLSISAPSAALTTAGPITYTVTYTGADSILLAPGLVTLNTTGTATGTINVLGSGVGSRTVEISGISGDGTLGISIASGSASDLAGNLSAAAGPSATFTVDNTGPGISISAPSVSATRTGPVTYTLTYSDASAITLSDTDIVLSSTGTAAGTATVSGSGLSTRTVTFSGITGDGTLGFTVAANTATDAAGNLAPSAGPSTTFSVDNTPPTVAIGAPSATVTSGGPVSYTVTYTNADAVTLSPGDVTLNTTGTATGTVGVSGSGTATRTVTITGISGNGTLGISIDAGTATDTPGNPALGAGPSATFVVDNTAPTISIGAPSSSLTSSGPVTFTVTYGNADAVSLIAGNVTLNATGTATGVVSVSGSGTTSRTVTISSIVGNGALGISIAGGTASDLAGNSAAAAGPSATFTVDNPVPTVSIGAPSVSATRNGPVTFALSFSDTTAINLTTGQIVLNTTGTATGTVGLSGSGVASRTVTISGITGDGTLSISLPIGAGVNAVGEQSAAAGPSAAVIVDNTAPTISIGAPSATLTAVGPVTYTVDYVDADTVTLTAGNVTLNTSGSATGVVSISGSGSASRTVTISSITGTGTLGISIASNTASDQAGNLAPSDGPSATFTVDNSVPSVSIGAPSLSSTRNGPVTFPLSFSNCTAINLTTGQVVLNTTGTATGTVSLSGAGLISRTVTISGISGDGTLSILIPAGAGQNALAVLTPAAGPSAEVSVDNTAPTISISAPSSATASTGPVTYTITYGDADTVTLANGNITLNATGSAAGTVAVSGSGSGSRTVTISSITGNGTLGISVAGNTASDVAGNTAPAAGPSATVAISNTLPSVSIGAPSVATTQSGPVTIPLTFSSVSAITLVAGNVTLNTTGTATGVVSVSGSGLTSRTVTISSITGDGTLSISVAAGVGTDGVELTPVAGPSASVEVDNTRPSIVIGAPSLTSTTNGPLSFTVTYTGATNITLVPANVTLNRTLTANGTVSVTGSGTTSRTVTISGITGDGTIGISLVANTAVDGAGNAALAAGPSATALIDNTPPSATIGAPSAAISKSGPVNYTVSYVGATSITLTPANITLIKTGTADGVVSVSGSGTSSRTVSLINLTGDGTLRISIAAGTAVDALGNAALAVAPGLPVTVDNTAPVITVLGVNPITVEWTVPYVDAGATALDTVDGAITNQIVVSNSVNVWTVGAYTVAYNVTDTAGNTAVPQIRTVNVTEQEEDNTVLEFQGRTVCRPGICVKINANVVFTPSGSFVLSINRPAQGVIPQGLLAGILPGTWFDVKPYSIHASSLGNVTLDYGDALAAARNVGRNFEEQSLFIYFINGETGEVKILPTTLNTSLKTAKANIKDLGIYAVGGFAATPPQTDVDQDLIIDADEPGYGTDPAAIDTDGDGVIDGTEIEFGTDPLNALDFPNLPALSPVGFALMLLLLATLGAVTVAPRFRRRRNGNTQ